MVHQKSNVNTLKETKETLNQIKNDSTLSSKQKQNTVD